MGQQSQSFSRTKAEFNPQRPIVAAWSLEYLPVNVSVVFAQANDIIGSRSWMFETFITALTEIEHSFPWSVASHVIMWRDHNPGLYQNFSDAGIYPKIALAPDNGRVTQLTSALISVANIDTEVRSYEPEGNNLLLIESLNGYSAHETNTNTWSLNNVGEYHYMTKAFEAYAVWLDQNKPQAQWGKNADYTLHDRSVI